MDGYVGKYIDGEVATCRLTCLASVAHLSKSHTYKRLGELYCFTLHNKLEDELEKSRALSDFHVPCVGNMWHALHSH